MSIACGQFGWIPEVFWDATPREFFATLDGHFEKARHAERQAWERARWCVWYLLTPHMDKNHVGDIRKDIPLPWDAETKEPVEIPTSDDMDRIRDRYGPMVKKLQEKKDG